MVKGLTAGGQNKQARIEDEWCGYMAYRGCRSIQQVAFSGPLLACDSWRKLRLQTPTRVV